MTILVSVVLVVAGVIASVAGWRQAVGANARNERDRLAVAAHNVAQHLEAAVDNQRQLVGDIAGLFAASEHVSRAEFAAFTAHAGAGAPSGAVGLGFIQYVRGEDLESFTAAARADGAPGFTPTPAGDRPDWAVLLYNEPAETLGPSWGVDLFSVEPARRALEQARDSGRPAMSEPVTLVIDRHLPAVDRPVGFVLYAPIYAGGRDPGTVEGRRAALLGWANLPMRTDDLLRAAVDHVHEPVAATVAGSTAPNVRLAAVDTPTSRLTEEVPVEVHGSSWVASVSPGDGWTSPDGRAAHLILVGGLLASGILGLLLASLAGARRRAQYLADAATRRLVASEARLRATIAGAPDLILVVAADGTIISASDQAMPLLGYRPEDLQGQPVEILMSPAARQAHVHHRGDFLAKPRARTMGEGVDLTACRADGSSVAVEIALSPLVGDDGPRQVIAVVRDVTARRRAEADQRLLASFVASTQEAVFTTDLNGRITSWNSGAERLYGWSSAEATGRHVAFIACEHDRADWMARMAALATGKTFEPYRQTALRRDGTKVETTLTVAPLRDHSGGIIGSSCLARDMTAETAAREALESYAADLERSNRDLEEFAYIVSHDLSEPLRVVGGYADLIASRYGPGLPLDDNGIRYIHTMTAAVERMRQLIEGVLTLSRLRTAELRLDTVALDEVLVGVCANLETQLAEAEAEVTSDGLPIVWGDPSQITQLLQNLVSNAIKFRRRGDRPRVSIRAQREGDRWAISVTDNGIGIEPEFHDRVFAMFRRLHGRDEYEGTGIGLALCRRVMDLHGGEISVDSTPGAGSTFTFTLEAAEHHTALVSTGSEGR